MSSVSILARIIYPRIVGINCVSVVDFLNWMLKEPSVTEGTVTN